MWHEVWFLLLSLKDNVYLGGRREVTSTISKLALFVKVSGECYHPQTWTDVTLLSWIDLRPFPTVHWHSDLALLDVLIFPFRAGQTKRREVSFISAFVLFFFLFCLYPTRATPRLTFRAFNSCWTWRIPSCPCQELKGAVHFPGGIIKGANRWRFQLCHSRASQTPPDVLG